MPGCGQQGVMGRGVSQQQEEGPEVGAGEVAPHHLFLTEEDMEAPRNEVDAKKLAVVKRTVKNRGTGSAVIYAVKVYKLPPLCCQKREK